MMEFTEERFLKIEKKSDLSKRNAMYFKRMFDMTKNKTYFNLYQDMMNCLSVWEWDRYDINKILDLQRVTRCKNKYCSNCRSVGLAIALSKFSPKNNELLKQGFFPCMITLTVPNCPGDKLKDTIDKMGKTFRKFYDCLSRDDRHALKSRYINIKACIRALEVTYNQETGMYHPHYHCLCYIDEYNIQIWKKQYQGLYRRKSNDYMLHSDLDFQIQKLWTMCYDGISMREWDNFEDKNRWNDQEERMLYYQCDCIELSLPEGIFEIFKYFCKDTDLNNFEVFYTIYEATYRKKVRQAYGLLHGLKLECEDETLEITDDITEWLEIDKKETPACEHTKGLIKTKELYHDYKKISRHKNIKQVIDLE